MELPEIAKIYFYYNPKVLEDILGLEKKLNKSLFKPINNNDEINFFSWLSEMKFGIYFDSAEFILEYNPNIDGQTPDWKLQRNDEVIFAEVLRLNLHESLILEKIKGLKEQYLNKDKIDTDVYGYMASSSMSMKNFFGKERKLTDKEFKYRSYVVKGKWPFILCIDCTELRLSMDYMDFEDYFIGGKRGFFYTNKDFAENVSGLLIWDRWNQTLFLNNPNAKCPIKGQSLQFLNKR